MIMMSLICMLYNHDGYTTVEEKFAMRALKLDVGVILW